MESDFTTNSCKQSENILCLDYSRRRPKSGQIGPGSEKMSFTTPGKAVLDPVSGVSLVNPNTASFTLDSSMNRSNPQVAMSSKQAFGIAAFAFSGAFLLYVVMAGSFSVAAHEQAVVLRFGKFLRTDGPGLHFKIPWIDQPFIVDQGEHSLRLPHSDVDRRALHVRKADFAESMHL